MTPPLAEARSVSRRFGGLVAVDRVDLQVRPGEVLGLVGANGAGKTTLIRLLLGLLRPTGGAIFLFGEPPSRRTRARLGYVPQGLGLYDDLTVAENLAFSAGAFGHEPPELPPELRGVAGTLVRALPLGLQRRVAFVQALSHRPGLLVLDEPTSGSSRWPGPACGRRSAPRPSVGRSRDRPGCWSRPTISRKPSSATACW